MARPLAVFTLVIGLLGAGTFVPGAPSAVVGGTAWAGEIRIRVDVAQREAAQRPPRPSRQWRLPDRRAPSQEPASARGYSDGYQRGLDDGRDRDRYDPVGHGNYRSGDTGYYRDYGPREAYRNNYRAGFRQGYENGYRDGSRGRR